MAPVDVRGLASTIVGAFHTAVDTLDVIKERKEKKKKKKERDIEELVEIKLLQKSLVEGANKCRACAADNHRRYGAAFDVGDHIAASQLKDVVISLQSEILQALQIARAVESAVLDLSVLHEASVTNRNDAIRTMNELCRRIMSDVSDEYSDDGYDDRKYAFPQFERSGPRESKSHKRVHASSSTRQTSSRRSPILRSSSANFSNPASLSRQTSKVTRKSSLDPRDRVTRRNLALANIYGDSVDGFEKHNVSPEHSPVDLDRVSDHSRNDSAFDGSYDLQDKYEARSRPTTPSEHITASDSDPPLHVERPLPYPSRTHLSVRTQNLSDKEKQEYREELTVDSTERDFALSPPSEVSLTSRHSDRDAARALRAPEVVTVGFEPKLSHRSARPAIHAKRPTHLANVHPALRPYEYVDQPPSPEQQQQENIWLPLPRPSERNDFHKFCKGSWQIRKSVEEGISIQMVPNVEKGIDQPFWCCKSCDFRSKALNQSALPDQIYFNAKTGIRYRWLFLAKSHVKAIGSFRKVENYTFGCLFCIADGKSTATYIKVDRLLSHVLAKHAQTVMPAKTKEKTKCIVGGVADRDDEWDINIPEPKPPRFGGVVGEFVAAATTGMSKYGNANTPRFE